jgi:hypothetical protein
MPTRRNDSYERHCPPGSDRTYRLEFTPSKFGWSKFPCCVTSVRVTDETIDILGTCRIGKQTQTTRYRVMPMTSEHYGVAIRVRVVMREQMKLRRQIHGL